VKLNNGRSNYLLVLVGFCLVSLNINHKIVNKVNGCHILANDAERRVGGDQAHMGFGLNQLTNF
jgi:hypothetical protein